MGFNLWVKMHFFFNEKETVFIHYQRAELASTLKELDRVSLVFMRVS